MFYVKFPQLCFLLYTFLRNIQRFSSYGLPNVPCQSLQTVVKNFQGPYLKNGDIYMKILRNIFRREFPQLHFLSCIYFLYTSPLPSCCQLYTAILIPFFFSSEHQTHLSADRGNTNFRKVLPVGRGLGGAILQ